MEIDEDSAVTMTEDDDDDIDDVVEVDSDVFDDDVDEYWRGWYHLMESLED